MTYVFDIDDTICTKEKNQDYDKSIPMKSRILAINKLYDQGHHIIFNTARGMGRYGNVAFKARSKFYDMTLKQLESWNVKFHELHLGKPSGDFYIDDKGIKDEDFFNTRD
tara:strand:+ start:609 stop:938 length:330 start_codon:yes stop_codon:yes gene_type:complete